MQYIIDTQSVKTGKGTANGLHQLVPFVVCLSDCCRAHILHLIVALSRFIIWASLPRSH